MTANWTPAERAAFAARRRQRNTAIGLVLGALVVLFYGITLVRMTPGVQGNRPGATAPAPAPAR